MTYLLDVVVDLKDTDQNLVLYALPRYEAELAVKAIVKAKNGAESWWPLAPKSVQVTSVNGGSKVIFGRDVAGVSTRPHRGRP